MRLPRPGSWVLIILVLAPRSAHAYRPFVSTDASVADAGDIEVEFGYIGFRRDGSRTAIIAPTVIGNLGLGHDLEAVAEFKLVSDVSDGGTDDGTRFEDTAVSLKWVAHEGSLHDRGVVPSLAAELSLLVPTLPGEHSPGTELVAIASGTAVGWTYHANAGVLVTPGADRTSPVWGLIVEHPVFGGLRAVAEVNGETATGTGADNSALVGAIWKLAAPAPIHELSLDVGLRHGISAAADEWGGTAGFTIAFPVWGEGDTR